MPNKALFLLLALASLALQQATPAPDPDLPLTLQQSPFGKWLSPSDSKEGNFPRYLICGAEMNYFRRTLSNSCQISTKPVRQPVKISCVGGRPIWDRCNGMKFKYCNFEDWDDQKTNVFYGSWEYNGMKMCPRDSYVIDYTTRITDNDGITALTLRCRNKFTNAVVSVLVKDGAGELRGPEFNIEIPKQYAYDFALKFQNESDGGSYITGLTLLFTPFPQITNVSIAYDSVAPFDIRPEYYLFPNIKFTNNNTNKTDRNESVDPNRFMNELRDNRAKRLFGDKYFAYLLNNDKKKYHGIALRRFFRDTYKDFSLLEPVLISRLEQREMEVDRKIVYRNSLRNPEFEFGKSFTRELPKYDIMNYTVPYCMSAEIRATIYTSTFSVPYTISITYTSGPFTFLQQIRGVYQTTLFGRPEIEDDSNWIC